MMAACAAQSSSLPSTGRLSAPSAATAASTQLLAASLQPSLLFPFAVDARLPGSPLSSRSLSRQLFAQPPAAAPSSSRLLLGGGSAAPPNTPSATSGGYPASLLPASGFGADVSGKFDQRTGHQQLLRYLTERHEAAQHTASHCHSQHHQLLQQGPSMAGGGSSVLPVMSAFGGLSSLPPPLSHPPLPAPSPAEFGQSSPNSPSERWHFSKSAPGSVLCQSPSSTLSSTASSSSYYSVDDAFDYEVELLADHFHMPLQRAASPQAATQRLLRPQLGPDHHPLTAATRSLASHFPPLVAPPTLNEVPALPTSGDLPPGCLLWQQEMETEKHELWSHTAQQLVNSIQQQQQLYKASEQDGEDGEDEHDSESSDEDGSDRPRAGRAGGSDADGSSSGESDSRGIRRGKRESSDECGSGASSCDESERRGRFAPKHASKQQRGSRVSKSGRHRRSKKRKRNQRAEEPSDEESDGGQHERRRQGGSAQAGKGAVRKSSASQSSSPLYSPSPSSFSTSTAASASSATASTVQRPARRPSGGHRSKLPARVVAILRSFFLQHVSHPFPSEEQKRELVGRTALSLKQVCDWFTNNRKRYWKPYERKMDRLHCQLVGPSYKSAQHTAAKPSRRSNRAADGAERAVGQPRTACRCGEEDVAIHDWRQMWD